MSAIEQKGGMFKGNSHDNGGIPLVVAETGQHIEVEGDEPLIPAEAIQSDQKITVKGTNKQIIDKLNTSVGAKTTNEKATEVHAADFIVCKRSANDDTVRKIEGTPKQIISAVNASCGCKNPYNGAAVTEFEQGGGVYDNCPVCSANQKLFKSKSEIKNKFIAFVNALNSSVIAKVNSRFKKQFNVDLNAIIILNNLLEKSQKINTDFSALYFTDNDNYECKKNIDNYIDKITENFQYKLQAENNTQISFKNSSGEIVVLKNSDIINIFTLALKESLQSKSLQNSFVELAAYDWSSVTEQEKQMFFKGGELAQGIKIEKEHKNLYEIFKKDYAKRGVKMPVTETKFYEIIASAHIAEDKNYYKKLLKYVEKMAGGGEISPEIALEIEKLKKLPYRDFLRHINDSYKDLNAEIGVKGQDRDGEDIYGYLSLQYDYMYQSAITGQNIRFYVNVGKGKQIHPSEVTGKFNYSEQKRYELAVDQRKNQAERDYKKFIKTLTENGELESVVNSLKTALANGFEIVCEYDSSDITNEQRYCHLKKDFGDFKIYPSLAEYHTNRNEKNTYFGFKHLDYVTRNPISSMYLNPDLIRFKKEYVDNTNPTPEFKKGGSASESKKSTEPFVIPSQIKNNFKIEGDFSNIENWQAKIILGNSMPEGKKRGDWDEIGYVMISTKDNTIVPIARSDEHRIGYELMHEKYSKFLNPTDFESIQPQRHYIHQIRNKEDLNLQLTALQKMRNWGATDTIVNYYVDGDYYAFSLDEYLESKGDIDKAISIKKQQGTVSDAGQELIDILEKFSTLFARYHTTQFGVEKLTENIFDLAHNFGDFIFFKGLHRSLDINDNAFNDAYKNKDIQALEQSLFSFNGIKNQIHNLLRKKDKKAERFFLNIEQALIEFNRLSNLGEIKTEQGEISLHEALKYVKELSEEQFSNGGKLDPHKEVSKSEAKAIEDVVNGLYPDLKIMEATMLYNALKNENLAEYMEEEGTEVIDVFGEKFKIPIFKKLEEKKYVRELGSDEYDLTEKGADFIKSVKSRIETRKGVKGGYDLFPETANIPEYKTKINEAVLLEALKYVNELGKKKYKQGGNVKSLKEISHEQYFEGKNKKVKLNLNEVKFDLTKIKNRRFIYCPKTNEILLGGNDVGFSSHSQEHYDIKMSCNIDDCSRGWIGTGKNYPNGIIHFAPAYTGEFFQNNFDEMFDTIAMFFKNGANENTILRGVGQFREQKISELLQEYKQGGTIQCETGTGTEIQSLLFSKEYFTKEQVIAWLKKHNYKYDVDEKPNTYRFRQREPEEFDQKSFRTTDFNGKLPEGVQVVVGCFIEKKKEGGEISEPEIKTSMASVNKLIYSAEFKNWFGDWENDSQNASKVVDSEGKPLVVYHGTNKEFSVFRASIDGGNWFTDNINIAQDFAENTGAYNHKILKVFLSLKNPMIFDFKGEFLSDSKEMYDVVMAQNELHNKNHDGFILKNVLDYVNKEEISTVYVVFSSAQIKLADGTNTEFNPENPDIRFNDGGDLENSKKRTIFANGITKKDIQNVISGKSEISKGTVIQAASDYLRNRKSTDSEASKQSILKQQEVEILKDFITENNLWLLRSNLGTFVERGAEQKVYFKNDDYVYKTNDCHFYVSWIDYFNSLLLNNYFFPDTCYELVGFIADGNLLFSVVKQPFIQDTDDTDLVEVKRIMLENGFVNTENNDYYNPKLGLFLNDLHEDNVLTKDKMLFFIDTVFYVSDSEKSFNDGGSTATLVFSSTKTGIPYYDGIIEKSGLSGGVDDGYFYWMKGVVGKIEYMSPEEYLKRVRIGFKSTKNENILDSSKEKIKTAIEQGNKMDMPMLNYTNNKFEQEGRNRASVAIDMGIKEIPVFILNDVSKEIKNRRAFKIIGEANRNSFSEESFWNYVNTKYGQWTETYMKHYSYIDDLDNLIQPVLKNNLTFENGGDTNGLPEVIYLNNKNKLVKESVELQKLGEVTHYKIISSEGKQLGYIELTDRADKGFYQVGNVEIYNTRKGVGLDVYTNLIQQLDKPIQSDPSKSRAVIGLWEKLINLGIAEKFVISSRYGNLDMYRSVKKSPNSINITLPADIVDILKTLNNTNHETVLIGGCVRDAILNIKPKDWDIEVYNISYEELLNFLKPYGNVGIVGKAFGVIKFKPFNSENDYDFSVPRKENKIGIGHKGFETIFDKNLTVKEASARRDFTFNSISYNPITNTLYDYYNGVADLKAGIIRHTSEAFSEDYLRILRALQFQSRFNFTVASETMALMHEMLKNESEYNSLAKERISEEWIKWAVKGKYHHLFFDFLNNSGLINYYPELSALKHTMQDAIFHPEGNVETHTALSLLEMDKSLPENIFDETKAILIFAILCHDLGKPETTKTEMLRGRETITSKGHEPLSGVLCKNFLQSIGIKESIIVPTVNLVSNHLANVNLSTITNRNSKLKAIRKLSRKLYPATIEQLLFVINADYQGRGVKADSTKMTGYIDLMEMSKELDLTTKAIQPIIMGRHLIEIGLKPSHKFGEILAAALEAQDSGEIVNVDSGMLWLKEYVKNIKKFNTVKMENSELNKKEIRKVKVKNEIVTIYDVNATAARTEFVNEYPEMKDWNSGGHHFGWEKGMEIIPEGENWIDNSADENAKKGFILHEILEYYNMKYNGMPYEKAHEISNETEQAYLKDYDNLEDKDPIKYLNNSEIVSVDSDSTLTSDSDLKSELSKLELEKLKLTTKALKLFSNSPQQIKIRQDIDEINDKILKLSNKTEFKEGGDIGQENLKKILEKIREKANTPEYKEKSLQKLEKDRKAGFTFTEIDKLSKTVNGMPDRDDWTVKYGYYTTILFHKYGVADIAIIKLRNEGYEVSERQSNPFNIYFKFKIFVKKKQFKDGGEPSSSDSTFDSELKSELKELYKGTYTEKTGIFDQRYNQLIKLHAEWINIAKKVYSAKEIAEKLFKYDVDLRGNGVRLQDGGSFYDYNYKTFIKFAFNEIAGFLNNKLSITLDSDWTFEYDGKMYAILALPRHETTEAAIGLLDATFNIISEDSEETVGVIKYIQNGSEKPFTFTSEHFGLTIAKFETGGAVEMADVTDFLNLTGKNSQYGASWSFISASKNVTDNEVEIQLNLQGKFDRFGNHRTENYHLKFVNKLKTPLSKITLSSIFYPYTNDSASGTTNVVNAVGVNNIFEVFKKNNIYVSKGFTQQIVHLIFILLNQREPEPPQKEKHLMTLSEYYEVAKPKEIKKSQGFIDYYSHRKQMLHNKEITPASVIGNKAKGKNAEKLANDWLNAKIEEHQKVINGIMPEHIKTAHYNAVKKAVNDKLDVPEQVLTDYPEFAKKGKKKTHKELSVNVSDLPEKVFMRYEDKGEKPDSTWFHKKKNGYETVKFVSGKKYKKSFEEVTEHLKKHEKELREYVKSLPDEMLKKRLDFILQALVNPDLGNKEALKNESSAIADEILDRQLKSKETKPADKDLLGFPKPDWFYTMDELIAKWKLADGNVQPESWYRMQAKRVIESHVNSTVLNYMYVIKSGNISASDAVKVIESAGLEVPKDILEMANECKIGEKETHNSRVVEGKYIESETEVVHAFDSAFKLMEHLKNIESKDMSMHGVGAKYHLKFKVPMWYHENEKTLYFEYKEDADCPYRYVDIKQKTKEVTPDISLQDALNYVNELSKKKFKEGGAIELTRDEILSHVKPDIRKSNLEQIEKFIDFDVVSGIITKHEYENMKSAVEVGLKLTARKNVADLIREIIQRDNLNLSVAEFAQQYGTKVEKTDKGIRFDVTILSQLLWDEKIKQSWIPLMNNYEKEIYDKLNEPDPLEPLRISVKEKLSLIKERIGRTEPTTPIDANVVKPAYLMKQFEYEKIVTPLIQEYLKFIKQNEKYFMKTDFNGLVYLSFNEVINTLKENKGLGRFRKDKYSSYLTDEQFAVKEWHYAKTSSFSASPDYKPEIAPEDIEKKKNEYLSKLEQYFPDGEITKINTDETKSNKRAVRRAIDNSTYKKLLEEGKVSQEELNKIAFSVGVSLPKKIYDELTIKQMENKSIYDKIYASMPSVNKEVLSKMVDDIKETFKPLEEQIFKQETERYETNILKTLEKNEAEYFELKEWLSFFKDIYNFKTETRKIKIEGTERTAEKIYATDLSLKDNWKEVVKKEVLAYIESLKVNLIHSIILNFEKITMPIKNIEKIYLRLGAKGLQGSYKFTFENGSSFVFTTEAIGAGGYNIQRYHFRYITNFTDIMLAGGEKVSNRIGVIENFSVK